VIGPVFHPRRTPPRTERRRPVRERLTKLPVGWMLERCFAPFARWDRTPLGTPRVPVAVQGLARAFAGYRIALVTDLHHGPVVPARWLARVAERTAAAGPDTRVGERWLYVSAGVGTAAVPFRWGNPPELPLIELVPAAAAAPTT
jgi:predicted MPP superfamily phosphohydrolase